MEVIVMHEGGAASFYKDVVAGVTRRYKKSKRIELRFYDGTVLRLASGSRVVEFKLRPVERDVRCVLDEDKSQDKIPF